MTWLRRLLTLRRRAEAALDKATQVAKRADEVGRRLKEENAR